MTGDLVLMNPFWVPLAMTILGLTAAFFGGRLVGLVLAVAGFAFGLVYGPVMAIAITTNQAFIRVSPWVFAILFGVLSGFLVRIALFLAGALLAAAAVFSFAYPPSLLAVVVAAVLGGALVCFFRKAVFAVLSAAFGGILAATGAVNLVANVSVSVGVMGYFVSVVILFILGLLVQLRDLRIKKPRARRKRR